ncbi:MAG TPA: proteasome accessory factor PafA2 family protein [Planctomycetota bacterium]|nr:proteasome accessory factor PafA2 family protein [Planctomycetota bacterium]
MARSDAGHGSKRPGRPRRAQDAVCKLNGADIELGGYIEGVRGSARGTGYEAARAVLAEIEGVREGRHEAPADNLPVSRDAGLYGNPGYGYGYGGYAGYPYEYGVAGNDRAVDGSVYSAAGMGRKFLAANGGSAYIDHTHLELCIPEVLSAFDHVAAWHAMLRETRDAIHRANAGRPEGEKIRLFANNSDGHGQSWGSHCNFQLGRACYDRLFHTKLHHLLYFASYLAGSIIFTGAGKVGAESGKEADFQMSARADFCECLTAAQTMFDRPIVNARDEGLCGPSHPLKNESTLDGKLARLHVIFFDNTLCHVSTLLKVGVTQLVLAMIEQQIILPHLILDDPLSAVKSFSRDPDLDVRVRLVSGRRLTAVELQTEICDRVEKFVASGRAKGIVPHAGKIVATWRRVLDQLRRKDWPALVGQLDWVLKRSILQRVIETRGLGWDSPEIKLLDHLYSSLDPEEGLYWAYEGDMVQKVVPDALIERYRREPPADTRAWLRAQILRKVHPDNIDGIDWDEIRFKVRRRTESRWPSYVYYVLPMHDPRGFTRARCEDVFNRAGSLRDALVALGMRRTTATGQPLDENGKAGAKGAGTAGPPTGRPHTHNS